MVTEHDLDEYGVNAQDLAAKVESKANILLLEGGVRRSQDLRACSDEVREAIRDYSQASNRLIHAVEAAKKEVA